MGRTDPAARVLVEKVLVHHGVRGMKWGKRKAGTGAASTHVKRKDPHQDHTKVKDLRKEKTKTLGNDELKTINGRLQLERNYTQLAQQTSALTKGQQKIAVVLALGATAQTAYAFSKSPLGQKVRQTLVDAMEKGKLAG